MAWAIRIHQTGGPEVLTYEAVDIPAPGEGEVRIRQTAIGLNFLDTYYRTGLYPAPEGLPLIPGGEGAGEVVELGKGVSHLRLGDRVAYVSGLGAYATERNLPADRVVRIPDGVDDRQAAAAILAGMTVRYLLKQTFHVGADHVVLFHAASGKVGSIAGQWLRHIGCTSIGTVGSPEKARLARQNGYSHVIDYRQQDFVEAVREITGGRLCDVVYDSVGKDTFPGSLDCLRRRGMWVTFGQSSGPLPLLDTGLLARKGSLFVTRPTLFSYIVEREELEEAAGDLFAMIAEGHLTVPVQQTFALQDAAEAHRALEGRRTSGATLLLP